MSYKHILLIEDDEADQAIFSIVLHSMYPGVTCTVIDNAGEALSKLEAAELSADLIFLDLRMPGMTGLEFLKELRNNESIAQTPVAVLSGVPNEDEFKASQELGVRGCLIKPSRYSELRQLLSGFLH